MSIWGHSVRKMRLGIVIHCAIAAGIGYLSFRPHLMQIDLYLLLIKGSMPGMFHRSNRKKHLIIQGQRGNFRTTRPRQAALR